MQEGTDQRLSFDATEEDLKVFLADAEEQLELLDQAVIRLEQAPEDAELIQAIFRAAHTLKGASATIGHQKMATLTHAMESVLDDVRNGALAVTTEVVDALLESLDALRVLTQEVEQLTDSGLEFSALEGRLTAIRSGGAPPAAADAGASPAVLVLDDEVREAVEQAKRAGAEPLHVALRLTEACPMPAVRLFQAVMELSELGQVLRSSPSLAEIEREQGGRELVALLLTEEDAERVRGALSAILDVAEIEIGPAQPPTAEGSAQGEGTPDAPAPAAAGARAATRATSAGKSVRIDVARLDALLNLVGELVIDRTRLEDLAARLGNGGAADPAFVEAFTDATAHLARITDDLQDQVMQSRMLPIEHVFNRLPRMVRDLAQRSGKQVQLLVAGQDTELDRSVIEEIGDPLIHLLRNAVDHGIEPPEERRRAGKPETGTLRLSARHEENQIVIVVEDDGRGIDAARVQEAAVRKGVLTPEQAERLSEAEAVQLIFAPGFSTASQVTDVSGRGVGMDIVRTNIERLGGTVEVRTAPGQGTRFLVRMPLTLAIIQALLVRVGPETYALPIVSVTETLRVPPHEVHTVDGRAVTRLRGALLPLTDLGAALGARARPERRGAQHVVAVRHGARQVGLVVDTLVGEQEVVIKSLSRALGEVRGVSGATILGDGQVALIVDVAGLVTRVTGA